MSKLIKCVIATTVHARFRMALAVKMIGLCAIKKILEVKFLNLRSGRCLCEQIETACARNLSA